MPGPLAKLGGLQFPATTLVLALCFANFVGMVLWSRELTLGLFGPGPKLPAIVAAGGIAGELGPRREVWRMVSAVYVHLGLLHLVMNMSALLWLGRTIESSMGGWKMITIFVLSGAFGFYASCVFYGAVSPPTAGASGAIFGLMGAQIAEMRRARHPDLKDALMQYLAYAVAVGLLVRVNNAAHLGGFLLGFLGAEALLRVPRRVIWDRLGRPLAFLLIAISVASQLAAFVSPYTRAVAAFRPTAR